MYEFLIMIYYCAWAECYALPYGGQRLVSWSWVEDFKRCV